ncbi:hemicentin-1-like [Lytechinus pictus]|uniref:hemicentin-1-like n=1 Tax=Lytechinus pictus TaxID=7653 RepID=UPI0030B9FF4B
MMKILTLIGIYCMILLRLPILSATDESSQSVKQQLYVDPSEVTIVSGKSATFACFATQHPVTLTWVKDAIYALAIDRFIVSPEQSRISVSVNESRGSYELHISDVQPGDAGKYHCELAANLPSEHVASKPAKMTVIVAPKFQTQPQDFEGIEGQVAMFRCVADGYPKPFYRWFDNSRKPIDSTKSKYGISPSGEYLTVYELVEEDAGEFSCEATNQAGKTEGNAKLTVIIPPGLNEGQTETRENGQEVTFACHVLRGDGQLSWWRNGKIVDESNGVDQRVSVETHPETGHLHLTIRKIEKSDEGMWTCAAVGRKGKDTITTVEHHLTIKVRPIVLQPATQLMSVRVGERLSMSCQNIRAGGGQPSWYDTRHGVVVTDDPKKRIFVRFDKSSITLELFVGEVAPEDQGVFCCVTDGDMNCFMLLAFTK